MIRRWLKPYLTDHRFRAPRVWSNSVLKQIAPLFSGHVINVSAWKDEDKEGGHYRDYFSNADSYSLSNFGGYRGEGAADDINLNLETNLPEELKGGFDVVYNHTTLEHIYDVFMAMRNLCALSRDVVVLVVPFVQEVHTAESFSDYWRFTPQVMERMFSENGFGMVFMSSSHMEGASIYHVCVAARQPEQWADRFANVHSEVNYGRKMFRHPFRNLLKKIFKDG